MKENTYDIPGYKVGLVLIQGERNVPHDSNDYEKAIAQKREVIVPFEDVDGILIKDVKSWLGLNEVYVQFYHRYQSNSVTSTNLCLTNATCFKSWFYIGAEVLDERLDMPIDKVIQQTMEELYSASDMDDETKRCIHCFFERYQDKTYAKTKAHIKRLQEQND